MEGETYFPRRRPIRPVNNKNDALPAANARGLRHDGGREGTLEA